MTIEVILWILILAIFLLIGCFCYLHFIKVKKQRYEEEVIQHIKFENKLKKEEDVEHSDVSKPQVDIEAMLNKMQADLEEQNQNKIVDFEEEQEKTSIISYKELKRATKEFTEEEELAQEQSPISLKEVLSFREEERLKQEDPILTTLKQEAISTKQKDTHEIKTSEVHPVLDDAKRKFQNTEFISPIYGKQETKIDYPHIPVYQEHEEVLSVLEEEQGKSSKESINTSENENFLNELKDFRNQL